MKCGDFGERKVGIKSPTVGGLFSGIAGLELGFQRAGMKIKWMVEIDPFCQRILAKNFPGIRRYSDVKDVGTRNLQAVDIIVGGPPCQPYSFAGQRRGPADDRDLWPEYLRVVAELRPTWLVFENVPGITSSIFDVGLPQVESQTLTRDENEDYFARIYTQQESLYLGRIKQDIEDLGYEVAILYLPACGFNAPHKRERVFVVAHSEGKGQQGHTIRGLRGLQPAQGGSKEALSRGGDRSEAGTRQARGRFASDSNRGEVVAYSARKRLQGSGKSRISGGVSEARIQSQSAGGREPGPVSDSQHSSGGSKVISQKTGGPNSERPPSGISRSNWWEVEPGMGRVVDGISSGVDRGRRLKALGNAVMPQVAEFIAGQILAAIKKS